MKTLHFSTQINAPADIVWATMLDASTYGQWTSVFSPGSHFKGSWLKGSEIRFLGDSDEHEPMDGLVGVIIEHRPHEFVSIEYTGVIMHGSVDTESDYARRIAGAQENYTFSESDGVTTLTVDLDVDDQEAEMFAQMWPKALDKLTEIAEAAAQARHPAP
ncbi:SRPBCC family protein [Cryobacterium sp. W22_MBD10_FK3]|uniref:SRPBCC family protein n=1 Tax=Cryobacterium sp. W22_MBD10_FK3 TaxID=3240273 RepID=UPI003F903DE2